MSYAGTILRVNLTTKTITTEDLDRTLAKQYLGGRGLATKMLADEIDPAVDPLGAEMSHPERELLRIELLAGLGHVPAHATDLGQVQVELFATCVTVAIRWR